VHTSKSAFKTLMTWIAGNPAFDDSGTFRGRSAAESVVLVLGLLIHDVHQSHFNGNDAEEDNNDNVKLPSYIKNTKIDFTLIESQFLQLCAEIEGALATHLALKDRAPRSTRKRAGTKTNAEADGDQHTPKRRRGAPSHPQNGPEMPDDTEAPPILGRTTRSQAEGDEPVSPKKKAGRPKGSKSKRGQGWS
jgi:hypothetical protein